eukprot:SAG11_NODE_7858_length_1087_cov_1.276316_1_plen_107_part_10
MLFYAVLIKAYVGGGLLHRCSIMHQGAEAFSSISDTMLALFLALLGDFDMELINRADMHGLGPGLFIFYVLLAVFVLLNMFIAILSEAYEAARVRVFGDSNYEQESR